MKVVLDTNVWLSALFWKGEANKAIEAAKSGGFQIVVSRDIILEVVGVANRELKFIGMLDAMGQEHDALGITMLDMSELVNVKSKVDAVKEHPVDNMILAAAKDGLADYLVSYDNHLLKLGRFGKTKIISPGEFLEMAGTSKGK